MEHKSLLNNFFSLWFVTKYCASVLHISTKGINLKCMSINFCIHLIHMMTSITGVGLQMRYETGMEISAL